MSLAHGLLLPVFRLSCLPHSCHESFEFSLRVTNQDMPSDSLTDSLSGGESILDGVLSLVSGDLREAGESISAVAVEVGLIDPLLLCLSGAI